MVVWPLSALGIAFEWLSPIRKLTAVLPKTAVLEWRMATVSARSPRRGLPEMGRSARVVSSVLLLLPLSACGVGQGGDRTGKSQGGISQPSAVALVQAARTQTAAIVDGKSVEECGYAPVVYVGGCTGVLVHPKVIVTAAHCGSIRSAGFGESDSGLSFTVATDQCWKKQASGQDPDLQVCVLAEEVDLPVIPPLFGCEADWIQQGEQVTMVGYGQTSYGVGGGTKLWSDTTISQVESWRTLIAPEGEESPCPGDSGGPALMRMEDGSWRTFGTVTGGTTGTPCNGMANYPRLVLQVAWIESQTGVDVTPCFDSDGTWNPTAECRGFYAGDHTSPGRWPDCGQVPVSGYSSTCGPGFSDPEDPEDPEDPGGDGDSDDVDGSTGDADGQGGGDSDSAGEGEEADDGSGATPQGSSSEDSSSAPGVETTVHTNCSALPDTLFGVSLVCAGVLVRRRRARSYARA